ncbi:hypothetical protein [Halobacterium yunchengense]|uniref:DUF7835 family putative zinc beta-ribbon protein n=1 Tax=Halobacterium yunchengense TaxID=3108497 RepID=UPI00300829C8
MSSKLTDTPTVTEHCEHCGRETVHAVAVELRTEGSDPETAAFSREPYRVATCEACGHTTARRMNDA